MTIDDGDTRVITKVKSLIGEDALDGSECLVEIYGDRLGHKLDLDGESLVTIGRDPYNTIKLDSDSVSRNHARMERSEHGWVLQDLDSTNGTYVDDELVFKKLLRGGELIKIGDTIFKFLAASDIERAYHEEIFKLTIYDGLTQVHNKRYLMDFLDREFSRCKRYKRNLSILMLDLDHFKSINDTHGHLTGDYVLKEVAQTIAKRIRNEEMFARYGGEEFMIIIPEADHQGTIEFAEIIRRLVEQHHFEFENQTIRVTVSIGAAFLGDGIHTVKELIKVADDNLYKAKSGGRNKVVG